MADVNLYIVNAFTRDINAGSPTGVVLNAVIGSIENGGLKHWLEGSAVTDKSVIVSV